MADERLRRLVLSEPEPGFDFLVDCACETLTDGRCCLAEGGHGAERTSFWVKVAEEMRKSGAAIAVITLFQSLREKHNIHADIMLLSPWSPVPDEVTLLIIDYTSWYLPDFDYETLLKDSRRRWLITAPIGLMVKAEEFVPERSTIKSSAKR